MAVIGAGLGSANTASHDGEYFQCSALVSEAASLVDPHNHRAGDAGSAQLLHQFADCLCVGFPFVKRGYQGNPQTEKSISVITPRSFLQLDRQVAVDPVRKGDPWNSAVPSLT